MEVGVPTSAQCTRNPKLRSSPAPRLRNVCCGACSCPTGSALSHAPTLSTLCSRGALARGPPLALGPAFARLHNRSFERLERLPPSPPDRKLEAMPHLFFVHLDDDQEEGV